MRELSIALAKLALSWVSADTIKGVAQLDKIKLFYGKVPLGFIVGINVGHSDRFSFPQPLELE